MVMVSCSAIVYIHGDLEPCFSGNMLTAVDLFHGIMVDTSNVAYHHCSCVC